MGAVMRILFRFPAGFCVAQWCSGKVLDNSQQVADLNPPAPLSSATLGKLLTHMCLLSPSSIIWYQSVGGDALRLGR